MSVQYAKYNEIWSIFLLVDFFFNGFVKLIFSICFTILPAETRLTVYRRRVIFVSSRLFFVTLRVQQNSSELYSCSNIYIYMLFLYTYIDSIYIYIHIHVYTYIYIYTHIYVFLLRRSGSLLVATLDVFNIWTFRVSLTSHLLTKRQQMDNSHKSPGTDQMFGP